MRRKDMGYKPEPPTEARQEVGEYFTVIQKNVSDGDDNERGGNISQGKNGNRQMKVRGEAKGKLRMKQKGKLT